MLAVKRKHKLQSASHHFSPSVHLLENHARFDGERFGHPRQEFWVLTEDSGPFESILDVVAMYFRNALDGLLIDVACATPQHNGNMSKTICSAVGECLVTFLVTDSYKWQQSSKHTYFSTCVAYGVCAHHELVCELLLKTKMCFKCLMHRSPYISLKPVSLSASLHAACHTWPMLLLVHTRWWKWSISKRVRLFSCLHPLTRGFLSHHCRDWTT